MKNPAVMLGVGLIAILAFLGFKKKDATKETSSPKKIKASDYVGMAIQQRKENIERRGYWPPEEGPTGKPTQRKTPKSTGKDLLILISYWKVQLKKFLKSRPDNYIWRDTAAEDRFEKQVKRFEKWSDDYSLALPLASMDKTIDRKASEIGWSTVTELAANMMAYHVTPDDMEASF
jgi:hypothetical protein